MKSSPYVVAYIYIYIFTDDVTAAPDGDLLVVVTMCQL